jgi:hypothetical protein
MATLIIGGVTARVTGFQELPSERGGGGLRRTVNGQLRGRSDWVKRAWAGTLLARDSAELAALKAQMDPDVDETISGDAVGSSVTVRVQLGEIDYQKTGSGIVYRMGVTLREV